MKGRFHSRKRSERNEQNNSKHALQDQLTIAYCMDSNLDVIKQEIGHNSDVIFRSFHLGSPLWKATVIYIDGLTDTSVLNEQIMKPLMQTKEKSIEALHSAHSVKDMVISSELFVGDIKIVQSLKDCTQQILSGNTALIIDGLNEIIILGTNEWEGRSVDEPPSEALVRGPREGFVEALRKNTAMLRRKIKDPNFTMIDYTVGVRSQKSLVVVYIKDIANTDLVEEVKSRIGRIQIDDIPDSGTIEQLIEDNFLSPFPQIQNTERPDRVIGAILEGRVAILVDGSPFALIVPVTFSMLLQSPEDYYERWIAGSLIRILRFGAVLIALFLPSVYVAFISYNHGLIPTKLVISIAANREGVPFPSIIEALIMEVTIEILREAGIRLPKSIGQAIGIVGGLVIGQAAVEAGIVSPIMVIVVALTAISSFASPNYGAAIAIRVLRFVLMMFAAVFGLYGVIIGFILITVHIVKLKSFGVNYAAPFTPYRYKDWKDNLLRMPFMMLKSRPTMNKVKDKTRQ
ncbi:MAG TPA: spore germination protein [Bacillota bacterium]|nr:spore germination protein [Bacillota bacterium]